MYSEDPEKVRQRANAWYINNRERALAYSTEYARQHRSQVNASTRRSAKRRSGNCPDCGVKLVTTHSKRCRPCYHKTMRGRTSLQNGYVRIRLQNGQLVWEHRLVWERTHGPVPDGHVLHHKNGDRRDNHLDNLECLSRGDHARLHLTK